MTPTLSPLPPSPPLPPSSSIQSPTPIHIYVNVPSPLSSRKRHDHLTDLLKLHHNPYPQRVATQNWSIQTQQYLSLMSGPSDTNTVPIHHPYPQENYKTIYGTISMGRELSSRETERVEEVCRDRNLGQIVFSSTPNMNADRGREGLATSQDDSRREKQKGAQEGKGKGSLCSPTRKRTKRT